MIAAQREMSRYESSLGEWETIAECAASMSLPEHIRLAVFERDGPQVWSFLWTDHRLLKRGLIAPGCACVHCGTGSGGNEITTTGRAVLNEGRRQWLERRRGKA
jgi:hypothetical protein